MWTNEAKQRFSFAKLVVTLVIAFLLLSVLASCGGAGPSDSVDGPVNADDQATATPSSSTTTTPSSSTTTTPSLGLPDLADRLTSEIASGECSTVEELAEDFSEDVLEAAVVELWGNVAENRTVCEELSKFDAWLSENDRRLRVTSNAPVGCDRTAGEVDFGAFPALSEAVDRTEVACLAINAEGDDLTFEIRGFYDKEFGRTAHSSKPTTSTFKARQRISGFVCETSTDILALGGVWLAFADLEECPYKQGFGPGSLGSLTPIVALVSCAFCYDEPPQTSFATDGFIWDRGWAPPAFTDTRPINQLDVALSGLNAGLFAFGRFDGTLTENGYLLTSMSYMLGDGDVLHSDNSPFYYPISLRTLSPVEGHREQWEALTAYRGTNADAGRMRFGDCADWNFDQIVRGGGQQPCIKAVMKIFQFDQATGYCSFLAEMPDDGADQWKGRWDELVFVDGFTPNVEGACLVDAAVDNDDLVVGHFVPSGTITYENQLGVETTVQKLTALRVIEWEEG